MRREDAKEARGREGGWRTEEAVLQNGVHVDVLQNGAPIGVLQNGGALAEVRSTNAYRCSESMVSIAPLAQWL